MEDFESKNADYNLWVLLRQVTHAVFKVRQKELDQYGIPTMHAVVLLIIQTIGDRATPAEISRWLFREPHSVSGLLNRMEKEGLVRKVKDLDRKNLGRVAITEKGQQVYQQSTRRESIHRMMSSLTEKQRQQLQSCLELLRQKAFKELGVERPPFPQF